MTRTPLSAIRRRNPLSDRFDNGLRPQGRAVTRRVGTPLLAALAALLPTAALAQPPGGDSQPTPSESAEIYLSENAMQILYGRRTDIGELGVNELRAGFFINEARDLIGVADALIDVGEPQRRPYWSLQVGPRAYGALLTVEDQDIFSLALGGRLSYFIGRQRATSISITAFYAPDIVTFGLADNVQDVAVRFQTPLTENTEIFVGYRALEFDLEVDREVDDNLHLGIKHRF